VRAVAKIEARQERFPRGWSNAAIMSSAKKLDGGSAMLCLRCKNELASENALDAEPDVDRWHRELVAGGERRVLSPTLWALFDALYAGRGHPVSGDFLTKAIHASALREHVHRLRRTLIGSRYCIETHRGIGYQLTIAHD
jgi:DNA-binding response OmpR family regulator